MKLISFGFFVYTLLCICSPLLETFIPTHFILPTAPIAAALCFVFLLISFAKRFMFFWTNALLLISLSGLLLVSHFQMGLVSESTCSSPEKTLKIVSLNCNQFGELEELAKFLKPENADVIFLQEFGTSDNWKNRKQTQNRMKNALDMEYAHVAVQNDNIYGLAVFSSLPIKHAKALYLPRSVMNGVVEYTLKMGDDSLRVLHVHLSSYNLSLQGVSFQELLDTDSSRTALLNNYIKPNSTKTDLIIGDFNTIPYSKEYFNILNMGYKDLGLPAGYSMYPLPLRIDYCFSKEQGCKAKTRRNNFSDHKALIVELAI